jgi:HPt (histidine-containing phosphotransfer) domain-containing protein
MNQSNKTGWEHLKVRFVDRTVTDLERMRTSLAQLPADRSSGLKDIARTAHAIHGSGAAFEFVRISELGATIGIIARRALTDGAQAEGLADEFAQLESLLREEQARLRED